MNTDTPKKPTTVKSTTEHNLTKINIAGRFDFHIHRMFLDSYKIERKPNHKFVVDLRDVEYIDSSALGMLLQLLEFNDKKNVKLQIPKEGPVVDIFRVAHFHKLFDIN